MRLSPFGTSRMMAENTPWYEVSRNCAVPRGQGLAVGMWLVVGFSRRSKMWLRIRDVWRLIAHKLQTLLRDD